MKGFKLFLVIFGVIIILVGLLISPSFDESEGGLMLLFTFTSGSILILLGLTFTIAKILSDKLTKK